MKKPKLKLYVWTDFSSEGLAFAIAKDLREAKKMVKMSYDTLTIYSWGYLEVYELTEKISFAVGSGG